MTTLKQLLTAADPLRSETASPAVRRGDIRRTVIAAASGATRQRNGVSRRFVVLMGGTAALLAVLTTSPVWLPSGATVYAAVQFEVRLAEEALKPEMRETVDTESGRVIYLHQDVVLTNVDIAETRVVSLPGGFGVEVDFTDVGAAKMRSVTTENVGSLLAIVVDGIVLAAPKITSPIDRLGMISGIHTKEEAERLAQGVLGR